MDNRLSKSDWERIAKFARTPTHKRTPEILLPDVSDDPE